MDASSGSNDQSHHSEVFGNGFYSCGAAPDSHGIPYSSRLGLFCGMIWRDTYREMEYIQKPKESQGIFKLVHKILYIVVKVFILLYIGFKE